MSLIKGILKKLHKKESRRGFSIAESLIAVLILSMATGGVVAGVQLATREYSRSRLNSETKILYSTLQNVIMGELNYTTAITYSGSAETVDGKEGFRPLTSFFSPGYAMQEIAQSTILPEPNGDKNFTLGGRTYGPLYIGDAQHNRKLISAGSYPNNVGAYAKIYYHPTEKIFRVELAIAREGDDGPMIDEFFDVMPLNNPSMD